MKMADFETLRIRISDLALLEALQNSKGPITLQTKEGFTVIVSMNGVYEDGIIDDW
jgi:hypothetical protein